MTTIEGGHKGAETCTSLPSPASVAAWLEGADEFGIVITDDRLTILCCNHWLRQRRFQGGHEFSGRRLTEVFPEIASRRLDRYYQAALAGQTQILSQRLHRYLITLPTDIPGAPGGVMCQTARIYPLREGERVIGTLTMIIDVTERVVAEAELRRRNRIAEAMTELSRALISSLSLERISELVLRLAEELTASRDGFTGYIDTRTGALVCPTLTRTHWENCRIAEKDVVFTQFKGLWGWVLENGRPLLTNDAPHDARAGGIPEGHPPIANFLSAPALFEGRLMGQVAVANKEKGYTEEDLKLVTRLADLYALAVFRRQAEDRLVTVSLTDELTGLYNRRGFLTLAGQQLKAAGRTGRGHTAVFVDLDGLKWVNDILGHEEGDRAIRDAADIIRGAFRDSDIQGRMGGDEFAVLALDTGPEAGAVIADHLREAVARFNEDGGRPYVLSLSIGTVFFEPRGGEDLESLLRRADQLMYFEKGKKVRDAAAIVRGYGGRQGSVR